MRMTTLTGILLAVALITQAHAKFSPATIKHSIK